MEGNGNFLEECKDDKNGGGEEYQVVGNFIHPGGPYYLMTGATSFSSIVKMRRRCLSANSELTSIYLHSATPALDL